MTTDREQIRKDAVHFNRYYQGGSTGTLARHCLALLAELEQAESRLAKVPALVEALNRIAEYDDDPDAVASATLTRIAADALYEHGGAGSDR